MKSSLPAAITKVTTMRDKTVRLQVDCQESDPETMADLFRLNDTLGWFFFHEAPIKEIDTKNLPEIKLEVGQKTPSERLLACLYVLWESEKTDVSFDNYYLAKMNSIIEWVKAKLPERQ